VINALTGEDRSDGSVGVGFKMDLGFLLGGGGRLLFDVERCVAGLLIKQTNASAATLVCDHAHRGGAPVCSAVKIVPLYIGHVRINMVKIGLWVVTVLDVDSLFGRRVLRK
jgi:hypothetical protein